MIWKRLKQSTPKEEKEFRERMQEEKPKASDIFAMIISAFFVLVIPSALVLCGLSLLVLWILGVL